MNRFQKQFLTGTFWLLVFSALALAAHFHFQHRLPNYAFLTGWVLFGVMVLLTIYNARKKLPFLPLGKSETWLQIHIYAGFFTVVLFAIHLNFHPPRGWFDATLAALFLIVSASGVVGLAVTRVLPRRLLTRGGEVIYEKIPALRHGLQQEAEALAFGEKTASPAIAEFYARRLSGFFAAPKNFWPHLFESRRPLNNLMSEVDDLRRFLNDAERATLEKIAALVRQKDGLDYHRALQSALKLWLFIHIPFTYSLMLFSLAHIVLVFAFSGGAR